MLKRRLIASLIVKDGVVVQSISFNKFLPVGRPEIAVEFLNSWGVDEIILSDIDATREKRGPNFEMIKSISKKCFVPLTVGGGIHSLDDMKTLIRCGADKVCINTAVIRNPELIEEGSNVLGDQCIVVSMDVRKNNSGDYEVFINSGKNNTGIGPFALAKKAEALGAGEIFLNSIDNDGLKKGYDLELISKMSKAVSIPVIACGGAGHPKHFLDGFIEGKVPAIAAGNYFHFTEHSPIVTKAFLKQNGIDIRLETYSKYEGFGFDNMGRLSKRPDDYLQKTRFEFEPEEVI